MKKSLYLRTVRTYIGVVLLSLVVSYFITSLFFHQEVIIEDEVTKLTNGVVQIIELSNEDAIPKLIEILGDFNLAMTIVNEAGDRYSNSDDPFPINKDILHSVIYGTDEHPIILPSENNERIVGVPITIKNDVYALFMIIDFREEVGALQRVTLYALILVLLNGSMLILLASRHLVTPIRKLTIAAKEMAKGNFSVRLNSKGIDEIGELITSFNYMASEIGKIDKMRDDFVSNVSHEIQSPLTSIKGFTKAIKDDVIPKEHQNEYLEIIYQESDRLSRLGENLLQLASLDSEHHPYHPVNYQLDEQIRRTVLATEPQWKEKHQQIELDLKSVAIFADQDLFEQVWLNLITNAIKFSHEGGTILIELEQTEQEVTVKITDTGKGIPQEAIPHLFERFFKADKARSSSTKGNGLGLSIVKKILTIHGCSITVQSKEGEGSTFKVIIPTK